MRRHLTLLAALLGVCQPAPSTAGNSDANEDGRWMLMERSTPSGRPLIVLSGVDGSQLSKSLQNDFLSEIDCSAAPDILNENRMPRFSDRVYPLEDALSEYMATGEAGAAHVASITGDGARRIFYTHNRPVDLRSILLSHAIDGYSCMVVENVDREEIANLITPTQLDRQLNGDQSVIAGLEKEGDNGREPRKAEFFFYGERASLELLAGLLKTEGFEVGEWRSKPVGVVLSRKMAVDFASFRKLTPVLVEAAEKSGVTYDGWETLVVHSKRGASKSPSINQK